MLILWQSLLCGLGGCTLDFGGFAGLLGCWFVGGYELLFVACWFIAIISLLLAGGCCVCWVFCCVRLVLRLFAFVDLLFMVFVVLCGLHTSGDCFGV